MPIGPSARIADGLGTACVGCADDHQRLWPDGAFAKQGEKQFIGVLQVLDDLEHEDQVKTLWQQVFNLLNQGQSITMALLCNTARMG